ncbi:MAG: ribosome recycling factor [Defluviitaleaceae bacterium]|nr:ribosome recycling factor [Defluviitaleaceae bacterium]
MINLDDIKGRMDKSIDAYKRELSKLRTGRASVALIDGITVDYYGAPTPIDQTSQVSVPEAKQLMIKPYDKSILGDIEKAINAANIGLTPNNDGEVIRLNVPALTEESRKDLAKKVKGFAEDCKVAIRNVRRDANDMIKKAEKAKEITEDDVKSYEDDVQKMTDDFVKLVDTLASEKEKDILSM